MSIAARQQYFALYRSSTTLDEYGVMSATPYKVADLNIAIYKNSPTHDYRNPVFITTEYIGITSFVGARVGDILSNFDGEYLISDVGDRGTNYQALFLTKREIESI